MKTFTYKDQSKDYLIFLSRICVVVFFLLMGGFAAMAQGDSTSFRNKTTIGYDDCNGNATVRFPVRENYSICGQADQLRHITVYSIAPDGSEDVVFRMYKESIDCNICSGQGSITVLNCRTYDYCIASPNTIALENGTGDERFIKLTIRDLPYQFFGGQTKFRLQGVYDLECCEPTDNCAPTYSYVFYFDKTAPGGAQETVQQASISSVTEVGCQKMKIEWGAIAPPLNCGTVRYDLWRDGYGFIVEGHSGTSFVDQGAPLGYLPPGTYDYRIRTRWIPGGGSPREAFTLWRGPTDGTIAQPNGGITVNVKSGSGTPIPGLTVVADRIYYDQSSVCSSLVPPASIALGVTNGNGQAAENNIYYGQTDDTPTGYRISVVGQPQIPTKDIQLDQSPDNQVTVNLVDTTSYEVHGRLVVPGGCGVEGARITAEGHSPSNVTPITADTTDADGNYTLILPGPDNYGIYSSYATPSTSVNDSTNVTITTTVTNSININYSKSDTIQGFVGGDCQNIYGPATVIAYTESGCFMPSVLSDAGTGMYSIILPSIPMDLRVENYVPTSGPLTGQTLNASTEIVLDSTTMIDFIFNSPIEIGVAGFPEQICSDIEFPILDQFRPYPLIYAVEEVTGCPVDTGYVIVTDEISSADGSVIVDTVPISNGLAFDTIIPGIPNIFSDYSKPLILQAFAGIDPSNIIVGTPVTINAIVVGSAPRGTQFTTVSPELPRIILRDPPGDASYSYITQDSTFSTSSSMYTQNSEGGSVWAKAKAGVEIDIISFEAGVEIGASLSGEAVHVNSEETIYEFSTSTTYNTSDDPGLTGKEGDVYIGSALNLTYANSDIISLDLAGCKIDKRVELVINPDEFTTQFVYAESDIIDLIIPSLEQIVADETQSDIDRHRSAEGIKVWRQVINMNAELKEKAFDNNVTLNKSFGGSVGPINQEFTTTTTETRTVEWKQLIDESIAIEAGFSLAGSGLSAGVEINLKQEFGGSETNGLTTSTTIGFNLDDNTSGDLHTVDWAFDPVFGTPVFRSAQDAGQTSCPWEIGAKRDKPYFSIAEPVKYAGSGVNSLTYTFQLGNQSEVIPADLGDYTLELISNPNGAQVEIAGVISTSWPYPEMPYGNQNITVLVTRNPNNANFHYEGLRFRFYPTCDPAQAIYREISAFFESPCSDIGMLSPTVNDGFVVNNAANNQLTVDINDYVYNSISVTDEIDLEYTLEGTNSWYPTNIQLNKSNMVNNNPPKTTKSWSTIDVPDGIYDIRMKLTCIDGQNSTSTYSQRVTGVIDRQPPVVVGVPYPADDDYESGDEIALVMNEDVDPTNATLLLTMLPDEVTVAATMMYDESLHKFIVTPGYDISTEVGKTFQVVIDQVEDLYENMAEPFVWEFSVGEIDDDGNGYSNADELCIGSALHFDGTNYVEVAHDPALNLANGDFTLEGWVNPAETGYRTILCKGTGFTTTVGTDYLLGISPSSEVYFHYGATIYTTSSTVPNGQWSHVAVSYDDGTKDATIYINGVVVGVFDFSGAAPLTSSYPMFVGRQGAVYGGQRFKGRLDDITIWNTALTQAEIMATMAGALLGSEPNLVANYDFNDFESCKPNTGNTTAADKSANGFDGTLVNFSLEGCTTNWATERSMDSDRDGIPDGCDVIEPCFDANDSGDTDGDLSLDCTDLCSTVRDVAMDFDGDGDFLFWAFNNNTVRFDNDFALEAWVNPKRNENNPIFSGRDPGDVRVYDMRLNYGKIALEMVDTFASPSSEFFYSNSDVPLNKWSHVAVSYDAATKKVSFYLNGELDVVRDVNLQNVYGPSTIYAASAFVVDSAATYQFDGRMDDLTIWSRSLSEYNVKQTMAAPLQGIENGLEFYVDFNEGTACGDNSAVTIVDNGPNSIGIGVVGLTRNGSCASNYVMGRNTDSDGDMIGDACDVSGFGCPPNYAGAQQLVGDEVLDKFYETNGAIESNQRIVDPAEVIYNSSTGTELLPEFEVKLGSSLEIKQSGCPD